MFGSHNPYQEVLDLIEECLLVCSHAEGRLADIQHQSGRLIESELCNARAALASAQSAAAMWRDSFNYHLDDGRPRADF